MYPQIFTNSCVYTLGAQVVTLVSISFTFCTFCGNPCPFIMVFDFLCRHVHVSFATTGCFAVEGVVFKAITMHSLSGMVILDV